MDHPGIIEDAALGQTLDSTAALVRAESAHLESTLGAFVDRLVAVPGLNVSVWRRRGMLRRLIGDLPYLNGRRGSSAPIQRVSVALGPRTYLLAVAPGSIRCWIEGTSLDRPGGPAEQLPFRDWATRLLGEVAEQNLVNYSSLVALRHLVVHDRMD